ncbi:DUF4167 domain-containing protein [Sphingomonas sp. BAUL-RG-20F-R05-02]|uniref:DUF4167 domain-containing protein n=1 Tax=Sphingomonas sp. BAUL-RG-20F-R05-02 TaxID=2914830 RepID=UPI001F581CA3|nr:DUF4167 domain-containing protein [Sphingomonas sp. BAUL-RG-20F-R05-02]
MINNRQAGRRRGRGGQQQRPQGGNSGRGQDTGNRIDNRARGNAAQLLEKYKALARDAQMQGDRVNIEYYLQFADHYFRVLAETRSRFEENNQAQQQGRRPGGANTFDQDEQDYEDEGEPAGNEQQPRQQNGNGHVQNGGHNGQGQQGNQTGQDGSQRGEGRGQYGDAQRGRGNDEERPRRVNAEGGERPQRQDRQDYRQERGTEDCRPQRDGNRQEARQDARQEGRQDNRPDTRGEARAEEGRAEQQPAVEPETAGVVAEVSTVEAPQAEAPAAEPRRRGRPRRVLPAEGEAAPTFDAGLLPPSLTAAPVPAPSEASEVAPAATDGEAEKPRRRRGRPPATAPVEA